jgi:drug/metabolite transporter (DMT)-like permease
MLKNISHNQSILLLVAATMIWGTTFPVLKDAITSISPSVLICSRFLVAAIAFVPLCRKLNKQLVRDGVILGVVLFASFATQTIGLETTSANRAAFITSLNVILVPILASALGKSVSIRAFLAAGIAIAGIGVMSWEGGSWVVGDVWVFGCALSYAIYILVLEAVVSKHQAIKLTAVQLVVVAVLGIVWAIPEFLGEIRQIGSNLSVILYLGLIGTAATILIQALAQRQVAATQTAVIYTLEPVFAAIFAFWLLGESLGTRGLLGAGMVLLATIFSQRPQ